MPLVRLDEEIKKEEKEVEISLQAKKNVEKKQIEKKNRSKKFYPVLYIICAIAMFGLGLLVIALINLASGNGFIIY